jgi:hypothetical protein
VHLPCVRVTEFAYFEVNDGQAPQSAMKEDAVDTKPGVVDTKPALAAEEGEIIA